MQAVRRFSFIQNFSKIMKTDSFSRTYFQNVYVYENAIDWNVGRL